MLEWMIALGALSGAIAGYGVLALALDILLGARRGGSHVPRAWLLPRRSAVEPAPRRRA